MGRISQCNDGMLLIPSALWDKVLRKVEEIHHELELELTISIIFYCRQKVARQTKAQTHRFSNVLVVCEGMISTSWRGPISHY
jgi:hypothetical protein